MTLSAGGGTGGGGSEGLGDGSLGLPLPPHGFLACFSSSGIYAQNLKGREMVADCGWF